MLDVGAAHRSGALRPERQRAAAAVIEGVHLLLHDVGGLPHPAREQLRRLERGRLDPAVSGRAEDPLRLRLEVVTAGRVLGEHVERAARSLNHWFRDSSRKNGLLARSRSSVVSPMCPGYTVVSGG